VKVATVVQRLDLVGNELEARCRDFEGTMRPVGTVKDSALDVVGDKLITVASVLKPIGYKTRIGGADLDRGGSTELLSDPNLRFATAAG